MPYIASFRSPTDDAEVLLRRVRAAIALGRRALGHVIEQRLRRGADDGHDVGTREARSLGLHRVVVDVAGGHDDVFQGQLGRRKARLVGLARLARAIDALERPARLGLEGAPTRGRGGAALDLDIAFAVRDLLGRLLHVGRPLEERAAEEVGDAAARGPGLVDAVDEHVGERRALPIGARDAVRARDRALDADGRVPIDEALHVVGDVGRRGAAGVDDGVIDGNFGHGAARWCVPRRLSTRCAPVPPPQASNGDRSIRVSRSRGLMRAFALRARR
jgi:hypothetical protein